MNSEFSGLSKYHDECKNIIVSNHKDKIIGICKMFLSYLESCKALNNSTFSYDFSILFNYWLYGKLINIYGSNNTNEISIAFSSLQLIWDQNKYSKLHEPYYIKCKPNLSVFNTQDWEKRKQLYDYHVVYDTLSTMAKIYDIIAKFIIRKLKIKLYYMNTLRKNVHLKKIISQNSIIPSYIILI